MLVVANDVFFGVNARAIVGLAARHRIPTIYGSDIYAPLGLKIPQTVLIRAGRVIE